MVSKAAIDTSSAIQKIFLLFFMFLVSSAFAAGIWTIFISILFLYLKPYRGYQMPKM
jgi:hypothetical protein